MKVFKTIKPMKYTQWIVILFCLIGMTACRQDAPRFRIGVAQCSDDSWRHKMNDEILREAMFYDGVSVEIRSAGDDNRQQAEDVRYFIDKGVDLLIISANEAAPMTPIVEEAYQRESLLSWSTGRFFLINILHISVLIIMK